MVLTVPTYSDRVHGCLLGGALGDALGYAVGNVDLTAIRAAYGPDGSWAELFRRSPEFIDLELVADDAPAAYVTIDRWQNEAAWSGFMDTYRSDYEDLDVRLETLTVSELLVARGTAVDGPSDERR